MFSDFSDDYWIVSIDVRAIENNDLQNVAFK